MSTFKLFFLDINEQIIDAPPSRDVLTLNQDLKLNEPGTIEGSLVLDQRYTATLDNVRYFAVSDRGETNKHNFWLYRKTLIDVQGKSIIFNGSDAFYDELKGGYIKDKRPNQVTALQALKVALADSRWGNVDFVDQRIGDGKADLNFYYVSQVDAVQKVMETYGVELVPRVNIEGNKITRRYLQLWKEQGGDNGRRFAYGSNALTVEKQTIDSNVYTALVGRGSGVEVTDAETGEATGGYSRKIDFADVEWSKAKGDPVDKPKGQEWVEWPDSTKLYGYSDGKPRIGIVEFDDEKDPAMLLKKTWQQLQQVGVPSIQLSATVGSVGYLDLGETVTIVRYSIALAYKTRVTEIKWNRKNENKSQITIGDKLTQTTGERLSSLAGSIKGAQDYANEAAKRAADFAIANAKGNNINYGENQPTNPKEGDYWYRYNADGSTSLLRYVNGEWKLVVDDTFAEAVKNKIEAAMAEADAAKKAANDAVDKANSNKELVDLSNQTAEAAKTAADAAKEMASKAVSAASDAATALGTANSAIDSAKKAIDATKEQATSITKLTTTTDKLTGTVATLATKEEVDTVGGKVTTVQTLVQQNTDSIKLKADQTSLNTLSNTVTQQGTDIKIASDGLKLKADQSQVNTLNGSVNKLSADLKVTNDRLSLTMTKNDVTGLLTPYATQTWTQGQITATANQFNAQFSSISGKVDSLKFGNRNLIRNSSNMTNLDHWHRIGWGSPTTTMRLTTHPFYKNSGGSLIMLRSTDAGDTHMRTDVVTVKPDTDYTVQFVGFHNYNVQSVTLYFLGRSDSTDSGPNGDNYDRDKIHLLQNSIWISTSEARRITAQFHTTKDETGGYLRFDMNGGKDATTTADLYVVETELAEGTAVPVYSPAPEDSADYTDTKVASLKVTVDGIQSTVANYQGQTTTALQTLQGFQTTATDRINGLKSQQTQLANQWTSVVSGLSNPNLILNSMYPVDRNLLGWIDVANLFINAHYFYAKGGQTHFGINNATSNEKYVSTNRFKLTRGATYTFSIWAYASWNMQSMDVWILKRRRGSTNPAGYDTDGGAVVLLNGIKPSPSEINKYTMTFNAGDYDEAFIRVDNNGSNDGKNSLLGFAEPKVELGARATPDVQSGTDSQITQLQDAINLRVTKNGVISQINVSPESILINGNKVHITGQTSIDNAVIRAAMIESVSASSMTTGTLNAANLNVINLNGASIVSRTITADKLAVNAIMVGLNNSLSTMSIDPYSITFSSGGQNRLMLRNDGMHIYYPRGDGQPEDVGLIHANSLVGYPDYNGLTFDLNDLGDFMSWGVYNGSSYLIRLAWYRAGAANTLGLGNFDQLVADDPIRFSGDIVAGGADMRLRLSSIGINGRQYPFVTNNKGLAGIAIADAELFLVTGNNAISMKQVKFPTEINSDGTVAHWVWF